MVRIVLHEKLLVCRRENHLSFVPGIVSRYKICKPLRLVTKLFIEASLLAKMICIAAINDKVHHFYQLSDYLEVLIKTASASTGNHRQHYYAVISISILVHKSHIV
jgi:hypothetical protein